MRDIFEFEVINPEEDNPNKKWDKIDATSFAEAAEKYVKRVDIDHKSIDYPFVIMVRYLNQIKIYQVTAKPRVEYFTAEIKSERNYFEEWRD